MMLDELVEKYLFQNEIYRFEGSRGVRDFEKLVRDMGGYGDHFGSPLQCFFEDNPGALSAVVEWIMESNVREWAENLEEMVGPDYEEDEE